MKILNLTFSDTAGSAYCLSHAINKTEHKSINLRSTSNYVEYPTIAELRHYDAEICRNMVYQSDVVIFHSAVLPFFQGLELDPEKMTDIKKLLYFHGSDLRFTGKGLIEQANELMERYQIVVSTPDLLLYAPDGSKWLPVTRSFSEIEQKYGLCNQDREALASYVKQRKKTRLCHAPSDEAKKGSSLFYKVITEIVRKNKDVEFDTIRNLSWDACLRKLSQVDIHFDQNPPFLGSYGMISVEASIFKIPTVTKLPRQVIDIIKTEVGEDQPFVVFRNEQELWDRTYKLIENKELREYMGELAYQYGLKVHDEQPVTDRLYKIIDGMP